MIGVRAQNAHVVLVVGLQDETRNDRFLSLLLIVYRDDLLWTVERISSALSSKSMPTPVGREEHLRTVSSTILTAGYDIIVDIVPHLLAPLEQCQLAYLRETLALNPRSPTTPLHT